MAQTEDRRIRKTKKAMTKALAGLLLEKPLNNISVREIAEIADINRGTFYLHYRDVYDMSEQLQNEIFEKFNEIVDSHHIADSLKPKKSADELFPMLVELFNLLAENSDLARVMLGRNGDAAFIDKLKQIIREKCFADIQKIFNIGNNSEFDYFYHYIVSGCIGICGAWLMSGMKETSTEMAALTEKLILNGAKILK